MNFKQTINRPSPIVGLAPMDGVTDYPFRQIQSNIAKPDIMFTEFVSADGISRGGVKLYDQLLFTPNQRPLVAQLFGKNPDTFYSASLILCHLGFNGIDINMGCPAKTVTNHGSGATLIDQPQIASQLIKAVQSGVGDYQKSDTSFSSLRLPAKILKVIIRNQKFSSVKGRRRFPPTISVKTRTGIDSPVTSKWISHLLQHRLDFITLHGRTLKQAYAGQADWEEIKKAALLTSQTDTKLWGNGDLISRKQAVDYCRRFNTNGALIGRAAPGNPWLFKNQTATLQQKFSAMLLHAQIYLQTFPHRRFDPLRHHFLEYSKGHPQAKKLRRQLVRLNSLSELLKLEEQFVLQSNNQTTTKVV